MNKSIKVLFGLLLLALIQPECFGWRSNEDAHHSKSESHHKMKNKSSKSHQRIWLFTCSECSNALSHANSLGCYGALCTQIINTYYPNCSDCANDIISPSALTNINGVDEFVCSSDIDVHMHACSFYCRYGYKPFGECVWHDNYPVCRCSQIGATSTTTTTTTTTKTTTTTTTPTTTTTSTTTTMPTTESENLLMTIKAHQYSVNSLAVLHNGDLVSASNDYTIKIWNTNDGTLKKTLTEHTSSVTVLAVLTNGDLASGSYSTDVKIWDTSAWIVKRTFYDHTMYLTAFTVLPVKGNLISGDAAGTILMWNPTGDKLENVLTSHTGGINSLAGLANGDLASCGDTSIKTWDTENATVKKVLTSNLYGNLAALSNGDLASSYNTQINIWDPNEGTRKRTFTGHPQYVSALTELRNGDIVSASQEGTFIIWSPIDGTIKKTWKTNSNLATSIVELPNGNLASGYYDGKIEIWKI